MNKNAAIIEGDTTKKFNPVSKVKVSNSDTGESTWIPEDSKETHSLSVIKNGIYYAASEGYTAYDTVTVNVSSETEVNYEGILADMPDLADLGLYDLDDLEGLEGLDLDLDEMLDLENLILDGDLEEGEIPTSGSTIKGIDPDSGETLEVGLDEDGNLMEQALPDHIKIVVLPAKRHYQEGEIIDFSYMHVYLMKRGTERFTCEQYPTGEIPFDELIFPVTVATSEGAFERKASIDNTTGLSDDVINALPIVFCSAESLNTDGLYIGGGGGEGSSEYKDYPYIYIENALSEVYAFILDSETSNIPYFVSKNPFTIRRTTHNQYGVYSVEISGSITTVNGKNLYYAGDNSSEKEYRSFNITSNSMGFSYPGQVGYVIIFGTRTGGEGVEIPVQWMRSDGEILEDTYEITIGDGEDPEPEPDPYADAYDFIWEGKKYCFNKSLARCEVMYSNGTVWQTWLGGQSPPYTVDQALKLKLIVQVGWSGGGSTSGGF